MNVNLAGVTASLRSIWDELVERRLWPLALALVVGIVAVPVLLSKPAKEASPPPPPPGPGLTSPAAAFQPAVSTEGRKSSQIRKNLRHFSRKNPFTPQGLSAASGSANPLGTSASPSGGSSTSAPTAATIGPTSGGSTPTSGGSSGTTISPSSGTSQIFYYTYTVDVKFGKTGEEEEKKLTEFRALPTSENPVLVYMGVRPDAETAVFLVAADASTTGAGTCKPSESECTFLYMKKGDKQTIEATNVDGSITDYTLKLLDVDLERTEAPTKTSASQRSRALERRASRARFTRIDRSIKALGL